jgi:hypothetical protein
MTTLRPKKGHHGWSCDIEADYRPDMAKNILHEYEKPEGEREVSRIVGLHPAVASVGTFSRVKIWQSIFKLDFDAHFYGISGH